MFLPKIGHAIYFSSYLLQQFDTLRKIDITVAVIPEGPYVEPFVTGEGP